MDRTVRARAHSHMEDGRTDADEEGDARTCPLGHSVRIDREYRKDTAKVIYAASELELAPYR